MIISYRHNFIFLKTRKTAGGSVEQWLHPYLGPTDLATGSERDGLSWLNLPDGTRGHLDHRRVRQELVGPDFWSGCWRFCIERNPWDKAVSDYLFKTRTGLINPAVGFGEYLRTVHTLSDWTRYTEDDEPVATVYAFEQLSRALDDVASRLFVPRFDPELFHFKKSPGRKHYSFYYTEWGRERVAEAFDKEIAYFGYRYEDQNTGGG